ncbi:hypothetical protein [Alkalihalobacillus sp. AL-G]|uniref:hypothetical protein n=1 Tax=Alkalihalobacillus sp. AL-G TaxID=2926399 RepID=UPI00272CC744|nr:hypothetical protein [Alkalihalobacillus sp. AL-G]WLD94552.1 hypothetical protein MOJ78_06625 [Alkalihalobacillus sp. AL-G]
MKKLLTIALTMIVLLGLNYAASFLSGVKFIDVSFAVGLLVGVIIWFFTSKGGFSSNYLDSMTQAQSTNFKMEKETHKFSPNAAFYTAVTYTIVSIVITLFMYRSYF